MVAHRELLELNLFDGSSLQGVFAGSGIVSDFEHQIAAILFRGRLIRVQTGIQQIQKIGELALPAIRRSAQQAIAPVGAAQFPAVPRVHAGRIPDTPPQ
jgi:hypothetical protein